MNPKPVTDENLGELPAWNLADLYSGLDSPALQSDLEDAAARSTAFQSRFAGRLAGLDGAALGAAIADYEAIQETLGRVMSFAQLVYSGDMSDPKIGRFFQSMQERCTAISTDLVFFTLELNRIDEAELKEKLKAPALARYAPWLRDLRAMRPHQLSDEMERLLHEKYVAGRAAWTRLFDETMAALRFPFQGQELTSAEILNRLTDRDPAARREAAKSLGKVLGDNARVFALITNTLAKDKEIEDKWRDFPRPVSSRNLANFVEDEVVDALVGSVHQAYPRLSHRYYALKAKWFGGDTLSYWDRNAPLPEDDDRIIPWQDARRLVLDAYHDFSPALAAIGKQFFEKRWIDAPVRPGKAPGAFAHPTVPSAHPYLLLNYQGRARDVMTLAHELGHGVHQVLAGPQGHLMADTPLTLAETASVFGEMLTFQTMLKAESEPRLRKVMLASKVEDMLNTVVRQIAMHEFETRVHDERRSGELLPDRLGEIWLETQRQSLGPAIAFDGDYRNYWAYIPHFIHVPFYVYAYAFGDCLVNSLYAVYEGAEAGFAEKYLDMLRAGGSKRHKELLAPFGLDASDPAFWARGLQLVERFIGELEEMD
ncbi:M3 family oligoendopeptidase [Pelagibius sp. CAU 1746]|uniref:M3 family oligoendopeptidase n=1 Tax=Pelagibius sp. CAU 1746 TaxID=3140370 RepID=UPI00325AF719